VLHRGRSDGGTNQVKEKWMTTSPREGGRARLQSVGAGPVGGLLLRGSNGIDVNSHRLPSNQLIGFPSALACRKREVRSCSELGYGRCERLEARRAEL
jgi:hypothetical protein